MTTAEALVAELRAVADPVAHPQKHYPGTGGILGVRMGALFQISERFAEIPLDEVEKLLDEPQYEPRMAAFCILDFGVRRKGVTADERRARFDLYLARHDAMTRGTWSTARRRASSAAGCGTDRVACSSTWPRHPTRSTGAPQ